MSFIFKKDKKESREELKAEIDKLKKEKSEQEGLMLDTLVTKEKEINQLKSDIKSLNEKLSKLPSEELLTTLKNEVEREANERRKIFNENIEVKKENKRLEKIKYDLDEKISKLDKEIFENKNKVEHYKKENENILLENENLKRNITKIKEEHNKSQSNDITELKKQKEAAEQNSQQLMKKYQLIKDELEALKNENNNKINTPINTETKTEVIQHISNSSDLTDIFADYLLKSCTGKFSLSLSNLLRFIVINIDLFDEIYQNYKDPEIINEPALILYSNIYKFLINNIDTIDSITLSSFIDHSKLLLPNIYTKNEKDLIKKIKNYNDNNTVFNSYKKKKDAFNNIFENNFSIIKEYIKKKIIEKKDSLLCNYNNIVYYDSNNRLNIDFRHLCNNRNTKYSNIYFTIKNKIIISKSLNIIFNNNNTIDDILILIYIIKFYNKDINQLSITFDNIINNVQFIKYFQSKLYYILNILSGISELELNNIDILPEGNESLQLIQALTSSKIEKISLNNCLNTYSSFYFSEYLAKTNILKKLSICNHKSNGIIKSIAPYLNLHTNLCTLNLSGNILSQEDFEELSKYIQQKNNLKEINLSNISMKLENCNTLGLSLRKTNTLESIILSNCNITGETINLIINRNTALCLKKIVLDNNKLGDIGLSGLSTYLRSNLKIEYISLENCDFTLGGLSVFKTIIAISKYKNIKINLGNNANIENEGIADILDSSDIEQEGLEIYISKVKLSEDIIERLAKHKEIILI